MPAQPAVTKVLPSADLQDRLLRDFRDGAVEGLLIDVQMDLFDPMRLAIRGANDNAQENFPVIGKKIAAFAAASPSLKKTWMIHVWNKQLRAISGSPKALATELVAPIAEDDEIMPKIAFCPFYKTTLAANLRSRGIRTVLMAGAVFESCVSEAFNTAIRQEGFNVALITDLTAAEEGLSGQDIENRFRTEPSGDKPWLGLVRQNDLLRYANGFLNVRP